MAGTVVMSTLSDGTNSTSSTNAIKGSAKAWVNFAGSTATIRGSFNVSSITRTATGNYTVNFTTAMPNTNYSLSGMMDSASAGNGGIVDINGSLLTSSVPVRTVNAATSIPDAATCCVTVFST